MPTILYPGHGSDGIPISNAYLVYLGIKMGLSTILARAVLEGDFLCLQSGNPERSACSDDAQPEDMTCAACAYCTSSATRLYYI